MNDSQLIKAALLCSLVGLVCLYFISGSIEVSEKSINRINQEDLEKTIKVRGRVVDIRTDSDFSILTIEKPETIKVVVFDNLSVESGMDVEIRGKVEQYKGSYEIIAESIQEI